MNKTRLTNLLALIVSICGLVVMINLIKTSTSSIHITFLVVFIISTILSVVATIISFVYKGSGK